MDFMVFSKHLTGVPLDEAARALAGMEIPAIDLTVRPGGHVAPDKVEDELPRVATVLAAAGVRIGMITTNITDAADPLADRILKAAAALGVRYYKLGYYPYGGFGTLRKQRVEVAARLRDLASLSRERGMHAGFHNHSADFFGAVLADVAWVLDDIDPHDVGAYFDPAHAVIEGGSQGWLMGLDLLAYRVTMLAVKDFRWLEGRQGYAGARRHSALFCPLADGNVPWPEVLAVLRRLDFSGPVSFHSEYQGPHSFADLSSREVLAQTARDVTLFRQWLAGAKD